MPISPLTPDDIAKRVGRSGLRVRNLLRQLYPNDAPGSGGRWLLTQAQVDEVLAYFAGSRPVSRSGPGPRGVIGFGADGLPTEWHWEGHVQAALIRHLTNEGWTDIEFSDTALRERRPDVKAAKPGRLLLIEVKGYPSTAYRDPNRAGEVKRTNPTLQAKHWFADALLKTLRMRSSHPDAELAICLPSAPRYDSLLSETEPSLRRLGIGVFVVDEEGAVTTRIEAEPPQSLRRRQ